jgi:hypothetical protein
MKLLSTLALAFLSFTLNAQTTSTTTVTMNGMSDIKLGMKKADFEKLLNQSFKMPHLTAKKDDYYQDTVHINYKGMEADVVFQKEYSENDKSDITLYEIKSSSPQLKTKSGIGIGDDKYKIISTYEGYTIWIMPEYENNYTVKSKTKSAVWLHGDNGNVIIFYLDNNKVTCMSVSYYEGD